MRKLGIVVFSSHTGLGYQSRRLTQFLKPERILLIDNSSFTKNTDQHPEWYEGFQGYQIKGFPTRKACATFLEGLTHLYVIENPLNWDLITIAKLKGIKTYIASNYEFCDNLIKPHLPLPDVFLMPSYWMIEDMEKRYGKEKVEYLPPPVFPEEFMQAREENFSRKVDRKRFIHIVGTLAAKDRNGTLVLLEALKYTKNDFDLVIKTQHVLPPEYNCFDHRVRFQTGSAPEVGDMYKDFDAMILPRRFGGLCLPMQEAMMSGLPVIMPDISPNNKILPEDWLVSSVWQESLVTRTAIDLYEASPKALAKKIDEFCKKDLEKDKIDAFDLAHREYAPSSLQGRYDKLW